MKEIPRTFKEFLESLSERGDSAALVDAKTGITVTYKELYAKVTELAGRLEIKTGQRILLYKINQIDWVVCFFAIQVRGGITVPVDDRVSEDFLNKVVKNTEPAFIFSDSTDISPLKIKIRNLKSYDSDPVTTLTFNNVDPDAPSEIIFTSGTWSDPKGVTLSQRNILANVEQILSIYPDKNPEVVLAILPLSHAYQQTLGLFTTLALGSRIVFLKVTSSIDLLEAIKKYKVTLIPLVPRVLELLFSSITRKIKNKRVRKWFVKFVVISRFLPRVVRRQIFFFIHKQIGKTLNILVSGGSPLSKHVDDFFQGLGYKVMVGYGLSECAPIVSAHVGQFRKSGEVGKPLPGIDVSLSSDGELVVSGENVFLGYWPSYNSTKSFATGDLVERTKAGSLVLKGRNKNLIVFDSGEKCFCEDLELVISELDDVEMSCVIEKRRNNSVVAECMASSKNTESVTEELIISHVKSRMPLGISVSKCVLVNSDEFPTTHTLKANRAEISRLLD
jgi:long-chain acyl-CoA synthetase